MKKLAFILSLIMVLGFSLHAAFAADYTFTTIDYPDASATHVTGINNSGDIVGYYSNATDVGGRVHGFLLAGGTFTTINVPGALSTVAHGINDSGDIVGEYMDAGGNNNGFLLAGGTFTTINVPDAKPTRVYGINKFGDIVGDYIAGVGAGQWGFLRQGGTFTYPVPSNVVLPAQWTRASGINDSGDIVGIYALSPTDHGHEGFLTQGGTTYLINVPGDTNNTGATGINNSGDIVGSYADATGAHGFLLTGETFTAINVPGALSTWVWGINDSGQIVGEYSEYGTGRHGFLATPVPEPFAIAIDIKPGAYPNGINLKSKGAVQVAILASSEFDSSSVDPSTVKFADASATKWVMRDMNDDGYVDMLLYFNTQDLNLTSSSTSATLTGKTTNGKSIEGSDSVLIVTKGKK